MNFLINIAHAAVALPDFSTSQNIGDFMGSIYSFSITIVGILIFVRFLWGGFLYLIAAANPGNINKAQDIMKNAVIGAIILFSAYLILYVINPDLVSNSFDFSGLVGTSNPAGNNINAPAGSLAISNSSLISGYVGEDYVTQLTATGGQTPYNWTYQGSVDGLSFTNSNNTLIIQGNPNYSGDTSLTFTVTDSSSPALTAQKQFTLTIKPQP